MCEQYRMSASYSDHIEMREGEKKASEFFEAQLNTVKYIPHFPCTYKFLDLHTNVDRKNTSLLKEKRSKWK